VPRIWKKYGVVPAEAYDGKLQGQRFHDHDGMFAMMESHLKSVKAANAWTRLRWSACDVDHEQRYGGAAGEGDGGRQIDDAEGVPRIAQAQPRRLRRRDVADGEAVQPVRGAPVTDNWWHSAEYYNVPLDTFTAIIRAAVRSGKTLAIGGDVSEPGYEGHAGMAIVRRSTFPGGDRRERTAVPLQQRHHHRRPRRAHGGLDGEERRRLVPDQGLGGRIAQQLPPGYYFYHPTT